MRRVESEPLIMIHQRSVSEHDYHARTLPVDKPSPESDDTLSSYITSKRRGSFKFIIYLLIVLAFLNGALLLTKTINGLKEEGDITWHGVTLESWLFVADSAIGVFVVFYALSRFLLIGIEKVSLRFEKFSWLCYLTLPYEWPSVLFLGGTTNLIIFPLFKFPEDSAAWEAVTDSFWTTIIIGVIWGAKSLMQQLFVGYAFQDLTKQINESANQERLLIRLESVLNPDHSWFHLQLLNNKYLTKHITDFKSSILLTMKEKIDSGLTLIDASNFVTTKVFAAYNVERELSKEDLRTHLTFSETENVFKIMDTNGDGLLQFEEFSNGLQKIFEDRKNILNKMKSKQLTIGITETLLRIATVVACVGAIIFIFGVRAEVVFVPLGTGVLGLSFAYAKTLQEIFDSLYQFYFVTPFHVEDWVRLDGGDILIVEKVTMLSTQFRTLDGYSVFVKNADIWKKQISNLGMGNQISLTYSFSIHGYTDAFKLKNLGIQLENYFNQSSHWTGKFSLHVESIDAMGESLDMRMRAELKKGITWQDSQKWKTARTEFLVKLKEITASMNIEIVPVTQPVSLVDMSQNQKEKQIPFVKVSRESMAM
eukprot:TRINITY_DN2801_c0_g1_i1.p1 TRINITY_DN2801_c0_g1~~TRINITY_DN2801_c0_g1_i1.p1  ORF type:complete len:594 (-),score=167.23 TRINITY_DN2801_c0_g1_i1:44-1825(-)